VTIEEASLARLVGALDSAGIPYMVAGSLGSSFLGQYRATNNADVVISPTSEQLDRLLAALQHDDYCLDADKARRAFRDRSSIHVVHLPTGFLAGLILLKERPFSVEEFNRRQQAPIAGTTVWTMTPEDAILSKLEWSKRTGKSKPTSKSEQQFQDALGVAIVQMPNLDWGYLRKWAVELDVEELLDRMVIEIDAVKRPDST
jgi:hypothetical protein